MHPGVELAEHLGHPGGRALGEGHEHAVDLQVIADRRKVGDGAEVRAEQVGLRLAGVIVDGNPAILCRESVPSALLVTSPLSRSPLSRRAATFARSWPPQGQR